MPQKEKFLTKSSKSVTNKLFTPIQFLKGVGPRLASLFEIKNIYTIQDLLFFLPRSYEDRSRIYSIEELHHLALPASCTLQGRITDHRFIPLKNRRKPILEATFSDDSGILKLKWFEYQRPYLEPLLKQKSCVSIFGEVRLGYGSNLEINHPEIQWNINPATAKNNSSRLYHPIYSQTEGLTQKIIQKTVEQALQFASTELIEDLPPSLLNRYQLPSIRESLCFLHHPTIQLSLEELQSFRTPYQKRFIFEEFFKFEWIVGKKRLHQRKEESRSFDLVKSTENFHAFEEKLPFELTEDQKKAIFKIYEDLSHPKPMNRLLLGDVGCGKTLVALSSCLPIADNASQAAFLVPTEILAQQHFKNAKMLLPPSCKVALLCGSTPKSKKQAIIDDLKLNKINLLIGTHAILEDPVQFKDLCLIITDEQHRFGVDQRMKLRVKGNHPHVLSMTATPIPRTLALTAYGDLDISTIRQRPKGRPRVFTKVITREHKEKMYAHVIEILKMEQQAYIIYPLVEESEKVDLQNAVDSAKSLSQSIFKDFNLGLLHGKMRPDEKNEIMQDFKEKKIQLLVSTTVVEVGVDVPNATVMIIEHAERFGLSQLHQLRGRIGRGTETSYCYLVSSSRGEKSMHRLNVMEETHDGFKLAEIDLEIRGPGEFLGTRQSGDLHFKYASLVRDGELLQQARQSAFQLLQEDPELEKPEHANLRQYMIQQGHLQQKRFETA